MLMKHYKDKLLNLLSYKRLLELFIVVIGIATFHNSFKIDKAMHYQRDIIIPAGLDKRVTITSDHASDEYIKAFARVLTNLAFNFSYSTVRGQYGELLQYFTPESFPQAKQAFYDLADSYERMRITQSFIINKSPEVDFDKNTITVSGSQRQWVENSFLEPEQKAYIITYKMVDGRFFVMSIEEKILDPLRQQQEQKTQSQRAQRGVGQNVQK